VHRGLVYSNRKHEKTRTTRVKKKVLDPLLSGKSLFGKDGAFAPMLKSFIEKVLQVEKAKF